MPLLEVAYLVDELLTDPSSHLAAATAGLAYPWSREAGIAADLYDLTAAVATRGGTSLDPYPRPLAPSEPRGGRRSRIDPDAVRVAAAAARAAGWDLPDDVVNRRIDDLER